jgi:hypothetical protein
MATAQLRGFWNPVHFGALPDRKCRFASLRASGLPFLTEQADLKALRVSRNSRRRRNQGKIRHEHYALKFSCCFFPFSST